MEFKKKKRVIFTGSGPSCGMGLPSINELCNRAVDPLFLDPFPNTWIEPYAPKDETLILRDSIKRAFIYFFPGANLDQINFEEALTVLEKLGVGPEISRITRGNISGSAEHKFDLVNLKRELLSAGMRVLWQKIESLNSSEEDDKSSKAFQVWKNEYSKINIPNSKFDDVFITTNYDVIIENALFRKYFYSNVIPERTLILKLHGSMNWYKLEPEVFLSGYAENERYRHLDYSDEEILDYVDDFRVVAVQPMEELSNTEPVIITPQISKDYSNPLFKRIWWLASKVLHDAEELVILGYSFSGNDFYVRKLIDIALNSIDGKITKIIHFDKDENLRKLFEHKQGERMGPLRRKYSIEYEFRKIDFSKQCPNFEDIEGSLIEIQ